jgi:hypothetical protein
MKSVSHEYRNKSDKRGAQSVPIGIQINSRCVCLICLFVIFWPRVCPSVSIYILLPRLYLLSLLRSKNLLSTISITSVYKYCKKEIIATDRKGIYFHNN